MSDEDNDSGLMRWFKSMIESNGCVHENKEYLDEPRGALYLMCKKCNRSWPI